MFKIGIIGLGIISNSHFAAYESLGRTKEITAVCDINVENRAAEFATKGIRTYTDYNKMLDSEEFDMVDICLPTYLHKDAAIASLRHGFNTLVEKPMCLNAEEADEMIEAEKASKGRLMTAHVSRFKPQALLLRRIIDSKELGKPLYFRAWRFSSNPSKRFEDWLLDPKRGGGTIFDFQVHDIDLACWYLGNPVDFRSYKLAGNKDNELGSFISEMKFESGATAVMEISHVMPDKYSFTSGMSMMFEKGEVETSYRSDQEGWFTVSTEDSKKTYRYSELPVTYSRIPYGEEIGYFIDAIKDNKPFLISVEESKLAVVASNKLVENGER